MGEISERNDHRYSIALTHIINLGYCWPHLVTCILIIVVVILVSVLKCLSFL